MAVAEILASTKTSRNLRVEGHTDNTGNPASNVDLRSAGFGDTKSLDTNSTDDGKQKNRRVEFHIEK